MATIGSILIDGQDPNMPALRAFLGNLDGRVGGALAQLLAAFVAGQAVVVYAARSSLYGNLTPTAGALGIVYNDGGNNGLYIKTGAAGSGAWNATGLMLRGEKGEDGPQGQSFLQIAISTGYVPRGTTDAQLINKLAGEITAQATARAVAAADEAEAHLANFPDYYVGMSGGVVPTVPFNSIQNQSVAAAITLIQTSGFSRGPLIEDATLTDAKMAAHPLAITKDENGRFFRRDPRGLRLEHFGWDGTTATDGSTALQAAFDYAAFCGQSPALYPFVRNGVELRAGIGVLALPRLVYCKAGIKFHGASVGNELNGYGTVILVRGPGGISFDRADTLEGTVVSPATTGADGFEFTGFTVLYDGPTVTLTMRDENAAYGLRANCAGLLSGLRISGFPGCGYKVVANDSGSTNFGNANGMRVHNVTTSENTYGHRVTGNNANLVEFTGVCTSNQDFSIGFWLDNLLNSLLLMPHCKFSGNAATVHYAGNIYQGAADATAAQLSTTVPGTNFRIWALWKAGGPANSGMGTWVSGAKYLPAAPVALMNRNSRTRVLDPYVEGGTVYPQVLFPSVWDGGQSELLSANSDCAILNYELGGMNLRGGFNASALAIGGTSITASAQANVPAATASNAVGATPTQAEYNALLADVAAIRTVQNGLLGKLRAAKTLAN
ncbi:hypothetical protein U1707_10110 [Sphingomonas sp. PB2P12]|uniref:hypothetical protein n=1 Tax=Sphingomonas sandaracina TaxID=3096157 RepID=UPI002FCB3AC0